MTYLFMISTGIFSYLSFTLWLAIPTMILTWAAIYAYIHRPRNTAEKELLRTFGPYKDCLSWEMRSKIESMPRPGRFYSGILLILFGYFIPIHVERSKELIIHLPAILLGAFSLWYNAPAVGIKRFRIILPFLSLAIPLTGWFLGFSPFSYNPDGGKGPFLQIDIDQIQIEIGFLLDAMSRYLSHANLRLWSIEMCVLCSFVLVVFLGYDLKFDKTVDLDYYRQHPGLNKAVSISKNAFMLFVPAFFLSCGILLLWPSFFSKIRYLEFTPLFANGRGLHKIPAHHPVWLMTIFFSLAITAFKAKRVRKMPRESYNIFISYKSKDALTARHVAEQLIASNIKVWFAEYELLVKDQIKYLKANKHERKILIEEDILEGIKSSPYGLAFTNDLYADSSYCRTEIKNLISKCNPGYLLEVMIPKCQKPHSEFKELAKCPSMIFNDDVNEVLSFLSRHLKKEIPLFEHPVTGLSNATYNGICMNRHYSLNIGGWELTNPGGAQVSAFSEQGPELRKPVKTGMLLMNLYYGEENDAEVIKIRSKNDPDDREIYEYLMEYANNYLARQDAKPRGLHLMFSGGFSQLSLTYKWKGCWIRKYSVILSNPNSGKMAEFVFTFSVTSLSFFELCRYAYLMDNMVLSLKWD
jgi:hypothetical protein